MQFDIISIFPESFASYFGVSILKRAQEDRLIEIHTHNVRDYAYDKHKTVDDTPYGGGAGMVLKPEPLAEAIEDVRNKTGGRTRIIVFSAKGKPYAQEDARRLAAEYDRLILVCGRYEGIDERVVELFADEEFSIGEYVLTGGEIPAMIVVDSVARLLPGVLGNEISAETESHTEEGVVEYPQYTKPEEFRGARVPDVLLSGHHKRIEEWRKDQSEEMTRKRNK
ncbi:MAG: tRNA (guanosine(37)-N1)-methyltransferase TrmD [Candidatus Moranbacteria bacterium]|nr:tRNA (guanosine(37)-N1)-methyltransferase TrmD [Candidatus Moranbacteria bacterium]